VFVPSGVGRVVRQIVKRLRLDLYGFRQASRSEMREIVVVERIPVGSDVKRRGLFGTLGLGQFGSSIDGSGRSAFVHEGSQVGKGEVPVGKHR